MSAPTSGGAGGGGDRGASRSEGVGEGADDENDDMETAKSEHDRDRDRDSDRDRGLAGIGECAVGDGGGEASARRGGWSGAEGGGTGRFCMAGSSRGEEGRLKSWAPACTGRQAS